MLIVKERCRGALQSLLNAWQQLLILNHQSLIMGSPNCLTISLTRNSIYSLHLSYYSIDLALLLINIIILSWLLFWMVWLLPLLLLLALATLWLISCFWMNDILLESFLGLTLTEQYSLINGIKWLIFSEWMLFYSCFWTVVHFRLISPGFSLLISYPLLSNYSFSIPFSNLLILIFSSVPIQAAQIFLKIGFLILTMEGLGQSICCGLLFLILQCKEFLYSYFSLSDSMIGSIFYFTTGLHGIHVLFGCFGWLLIIYLTTREPFLNYIYFIDFFNWLPIYRFSGSRIWLKDFIDVNFLFMISPNNNPLFFTEQSLNFFSASYYWHFVDWIWFFVFLALIIVKGLNDSLIFYRCRAASSLITYNHWIKDQSKMERRDWRAPRHRSFLS